MPITEALKKLIKTITGKNAVGETIEELVRELNNNYPEGGSGGGSDITFITATLDPVTNEISNASMTLDECLAAYAEGKRLGFRLTAEIAGIGAARVEFPLAIISRAVVDGEVQGEAIFSTMSQSDGHPEALSVSAATGDADGAWVFKTESIGNNLKVIHGELTPKGEPGSETFDLEIQESADELREILNSEDVAALDAIVVSSSSSSILAGMHVYCIMTMCHSETDGAVASGHVVMSSDSNRMLVALIQLGVIYEDENWRVFSSAYTRRYKMTDIPDYSVADAGKVLSVNSEGELAWVTPA